MGLVEAVKGDDRRNALADTCSCLPSASRGCKYEDDVRRSSGDAVMIPRFDPAAPPNDTQE